MRLTLRTLLAWLDDTLPGAEVKQIGKQVAESPFAQELVDKTYRVTRQRRLLVPPSSGPEGTDPNLVAAYLDNELPAEEVAEYEKKCLTSDVNLAEVASVHQILSLIGQKAKVPAEAKSRMYRLIKGRESAGTRVMRSSRPSQPESVTPPISPWSAPTPTYRPLAERVGIAALVVGLIGVVGWTAFSTFQGEPAPSAEGLLADAGAKQPPASGVDPAGERPASATKDLRPAPSKSAETDRTASADPKKSADPGTTGSPAGAVKLVKADQVALAWNPEKSDWARLKETTAVKDGTRLLGLAPFRPTFQIGPAQVLLIGDTEGTISAADGRSGVRLVVGHGRIILRGAADSRPYLIEGTGQTLTVESKPGATIGLERSWRLAPGEAAVPVAPLVIYLAEGEATLRVGETNLPLRGPKAVNLDKGKLTTLADAATPAWLSTESASPADKQLGERFLSCFSANGSVLRDLVQAVDGDDPDVRHLAIIGLGAVGDAEMVVPVLNNGMTDAGSRKAAADVLLSMLARGGEAAKGVRSELVKVFGDDWAADTEKLLVGFTAEQKKREQTYAELVKLLEAPELGTRGLAIRSLMQLTGRDSLEYDPLKPTGKGLRAWQDLLHKKELMKAMPAPPIPGS